MHKESVELKHNHGGYSTVIRKMGSSTISPLYDSKTLVLTFSFFCIKLFFIDGSKPEIFSDNLDLFESLKKSGELKRNHLGYDIVLRERDGWFDFGSGQ